jgi:hypothetical protein
MWSVPSSRGTLSVRSCTSCSPLWSAMLCRGAWSLLKAERRVRDDTVQAMHDARVARKGMESTLSR